MFSALLESFLDNVLSFFFPHLQNKKRRKEDWYGVVEKKKTKTDFSVSRFACYVIFKKDDGSLAKIHVDEDEFNLYEIGKMYHKKEGEDLPVPYDPTEPR